MGLRHLRPAQRRAGRQRHRLPAEDGGARRRQGARPLPGPAGRLVQADRRLDVRGGRRRRVTRPPTTYPRRWSPSPTSCWARRATSASTPAGWCSPSGRSARSCPIERARMEQAHRAAVGQGRLRVHGAGEVRPARASGMLGALDHMMRIVAEHLGEHWDLATMPKEEPAVYDMLCRADSIGVFQVESRAQIGTLPRLRPREFYDLAIEIALIRPGPIQGGAVHPYVRRATGQRGGHLRPPRAGAGAGAHPGRAALPGAADGDGASPSATAAATTPTCCAGRWAPSAGSSGSSRSRRSSTPAWRAAGIAGDAGRRDLRQDPVLRQLRLRRVPRAVLRAARLRLLVVQAALPGGVPGRRCCATSRWASTRRSRWSATPAGTASRYAGPTSPGPRRRPTSSRSSIGPVAATGLDACCRPRFERTEWVPGTPDPTPAHRRDAALRRPARARLGARHRSRGRRAGSSRPATSAPFTGVTDLSRRAGLDLAQLEALATAGAFDALGTGPPARRSGRPASPSAPSTSPAPRRPRPRRCCPA